MINDYCHEGKSGKRFLYNLNVRADYEAKLLIEEICHKERCTRSELIVKCVRLYAELSENYLDMPAPATRDNLKMLLELRQACETTLETVEGMLSKKMLT